MKRSEINQALRAAMAILATHHITLPSFAYWPPERWRTLEPAYDRVARNGLGWDISDFGGGDFQRFGAVLFTVRNGNIQHLEDGTPYCEKIIVMQPGQRMPLHMHWSKTEDIINRAGGVLVMELYHACDDDTPDRDHPVTFFTDGCRRTVDAGAHVVFQPGESITIPPRLFHRFWAAPEGGVLVCGEVSTINDDRVDNCFAEPTSRFAAITEDEPPVVLLCNEYPGRESVTA